jgi:hypothetical protein
VVLAQRGGKSGEESAVVREGRRNRGKGGEEMVMLAQRGGESGEESATVREGRRK